MQLGVGSSGGRGHRGVTPSSPALLPPLLPHVGDDVVLHGGDVGAVVPAHDGHAVGAHQELLEVPLDVVVPQGLPEEVLGVPELLRHRWAGVLQGWGNRSVPCVSPSPKIRHAGCWPPPLALHPPSGSCRPSAPWPHSHPLSGRAGSWGRSRLLAGRTCRGTAGGDPHLTHRGGCPKPHQQPLRYSLQRREDLGVLARLLLPELVGGEAQDHEPVGPQLIL